ncbi:hypothetical protein AAK964_00790 [Tissierella praeacuta]|uniref:hypothetical protein n=1 Tax=Tissierella praeacuta TaxID=43131 RepID=UPI0035156C89
MAEQYRFFDSIDGEDERFYTADEFAEYFRQFISNGIFNGGDNLRVFTTGTDMTINIEEGYAWIEGYLYKIETEALKLTLDAADPALNRIDRIVIRLDKSLEKRYVKAFILKGIPAESPVASEITRNDNTYEISLAKINVLAGKSFIGEEEVIDERFNEEVCGVVNSLIKVDTQHLIDRLQGEWETWFEEVKDETYITQKDVGNHILPYTGRYMEYTSVSKLTNIVGNPGSFRIKDGQLKGIVEISPRPEGFKSWGSILYEKEETVGSSVNLEAIAKNEELDVVHDYTKGNYTFTTETTYNSSTEKIHYTFAIPFRTPSSFSHELSKEALVIKTRLGRSHTGYSPTVDIKLVEKISDRPGTTELAHTRVTFASGTTDEEFNIKLILKKDILLKPDTDYFITFSNLSNVSNPILYQLKVSYTDINIVPPEDRVEEKRIWWGAGASWTKLADKYAWMKVSLNKYDILKSDIKSGDILDKLPKETQFVFNLQREDVTNQSPKVYDISITAKGINQIKGMIPSDSVILEYPAARSHENTNPLPVCRANLTFGGRYRLKCEMYVYTVSSYSVYVDVFLESVNGAKLGSGFVRDNSWTPISIDLEAVPPNSRIVVAIRAGYAHSSYRAYIRNIQICGELGSQHRDMEIL